LTPGATIPPADVVDRLLRARLSPTLGLVEAIPTSPLTLRRRRVTIGKLKR